MAYAGIAIFVTQAEYDDNGYAARDLVADELATRLDNTNISYDIVKASDTPSVSTQDPSCGSGLLNEWDRLINNQAVVPNTADSHLLITNSTSTKGCGEVPGDACVFGAGPSLASASSIDEYGSGTEYYAFNGCCHEIFHNFNCNHKHGDNQFKTPSSKPDGYYVTPMLTGYKNKLCGQDNPCNNYIDCDNIEGHDAQWSDCAESQAETYLS